MIHCSGGAQTKVLNFINNLKIIKDNLFTVPPLFKYIQEESGTPWYEMYKVFNMGHRMEIYTTKEASSGIIAISKKFGVDAKIIGKVEGSSKREVVLKTEFGDFNYGM